MVFDKFTNLKLNSNCSTGILLRPWIADRSFLGFSVRPVKSSWFGIFHEVVKRPSQVWLSFYLRQNAFTKSAFFLKRDIFGGP